MLMAAYVHAMLAVSAVLINFAASDALARSERVMPIQVAETDPDSEAEPPVSGREPSSGSYSIQFGYALSEADANRLKRKTARQLGIQENEITIRPSIKSANPTYLVVYGQFPSRDQGRNRCRQMKLSDDDCWVINNISK